MQVVVLSPHRDDAAFSCGLLIFHFLRAGHEVSVANVCTVSDYAPYLQPSRDMDWVDQVTAERSSEDEAFSRSVRRAAGPEATRLTFVDLAWKDAPLRWNMPADSTDLVGAVQTEEVKSLANGLGNLCKAALVLAPSALGGHPDHVLTREAALLATADQGHPLFYEDLPYGCRATASERDALRVRALHHFSDEWLSPPVPGTHLKTEFAMCYPSQIAAGVAQEIQEHADRLGKRERFWGRPSAVSAIADATKQGVAA